MNPTPEPIRLTAEQKAKLERLAAKFGCLAARGINAGKPSWRVLVKDVAEGRLEVSPKAP